MSLVAGKQWVLASKQAQVGARKQASRWARERAGGASKQEGGLLLGCRAKIRLAPLRGGKEPGF